MTGRPVDAFEVLGLPYDPDLGDERVHEAYRLRLRATHPDNGGDEGCAAAVTAAYTALRSGVRRAELLGAVSLDQLARQAGPARRERPPWLRGPWAVSARPEAPVARPAGGGPAPDEARRAELRAEVAESRRRQGLPPYITNEATLEKIAELLAAVLERDTQPRSRAAPPAGAAAARAEAPARAAGREPAVTCGWLGRAWLRVCDGRPEMLAARAVVAVLVPVAGWAAAPGYPAWPALAVGAATWLVLTGRWDLAPRGRR